MKTPTATAYLSCVLGCVYLALLNPATAASPTLEWIEQFGTTSLDDSLAISADGLGNVYITGRTRGSLVSPNFGIEDGFVSKYDANGSLLWTEQLGTSSDDVSLGVSADGLGNVYITGFTLGSLEGANAGLTDAFLAKFSDPIPEPSTLLLGAMAAVGWRCGAPAMRCIAVNSHCPLASDY